jgi:HAD superfamily hydrolase (TIGR01509 family)
VLFDVDGTLADTERDGHRPAFNRAFAEFGLDHRWGVEEYGRLLAVTGGQRRIEQFLAQRGHADPAGIATTLHRAKTGHFIDWVRTGPVRCRPGVDGLIAGLGAAGMRIGVVTTGRRAWVLPLLDRLFGLATFEVVVTGDDVERLKPAPDAYLLALDRLGSAAAAAIAVEDSPPGLAAARAAGLACVVVSNDYTAGADFPGAAAVLPSFDGLDAARLLRETRRG